MQESSPGRVRLAAAEAQELSERALRGNGVTFMPTPGSYYDMLPERIEKSGIKSIDEDIKILFALR